MIPGTALFRRFTIRKTQANIHTTYMHIAYIDVYFGKQYKDQQIREAPEKCKKANDMQNCKCQLIGSGNVAIAFLQTKPTNIN